MNGMFDVKVKREEKKQERFERFVKNPYFFLVHYLIAQFHLSETNYITICSRAYSLSLSHSNAFVCVCMCNCVLLCPFRYAASVFFLCSVNALKIMFLFRLFLHLLVIQALKKKIVWQKKSEL